MSKLIDMTPMADSIISRFLLSDQPNMIQLQEKTRKWRKVLDFETRGLPSSCHRNPNLPCVRQTLYGQDYVPSLRVPASIAWQFALTISNTWVKSTRAHFIMQVVNSEL